MVRSFLLALTALVMLVQATASAASWQHFSSKPLGFALQYPPGWLLTTSQQPKQISVQHQGRPMYSLQVSLLAVKPGSSISQTLSRVKNYERSLGDTAFASIHWSSISIGGRGAMVGVFRPSTEGGVAISTAIYITASRIHVYELTAVDYRHPPATKVASFPGIYHQILSTWRFL
jgi:hypothetical protein